MHKFTKSDCSFYAKKNCGQCYGRGYVTKSIPFPKMTRAMLVLTNVERVADPEWEEACECVTKRLGPVEIAAETAD